MTGGEPKDHEIVARTGTLLRERNGRLILSSQNLAEVNLNRRLSSRTRDLEGHNRSRAIAFEQAIDRLQEQRFGAAGGLRNLSMESEIALKIQRLVSQFEGSLEL